MLPILPFIAGAAIGAAGIILFGDKKAKKKLIEGRLYVESKLQEGKEGVSAITECVKEKVNKNKKAAKATDTDESKL